MISVPVNTTVTFLTRSKIFIHPEHLIANHVLFLWSKIFIQHEQHIIMFLLKYYSFIGTYCFFFFSFMLLGLFLPASSFPFLYHLMLGAGFPATISHFSTVFFPSSTVTLRRSFNLGSAETKTEHKTEITHRKPSTLTRVNLAIFHPILSIFLL